MVRKICSLLPSSVLISGQPSQPGSVKISSAQPVKHKEGRVDFQHHITRDDGIATVKNCWAIFPCSEPNEGWLRRVWWGWGADSSWLVTTEKCMFVHLNSGLSLLTSLLSPQHPQEGFRVTPISADPALHPLPLLKDKRTWSTWHLQDALLQEHPWGSNSPKKTHPVSSRFPFASLWFLLLQTSCCYWYFFFFASAKGHQAKSAVSHPSSLSLTVSDNSLQSVSVSSPGAGWVSQSRGSNFSLC